MSRSECNEVKARAFPLSDMLPHNSTAATNVRGLLERRKHDWKRKGGGGHDEEEGDEMGRRN